MITFAGVMYLWIRISINKNLTVLSISSVFTNHRKRNNGFRTEPNYNVNELLMRLNSVGKLKRLPISVP